MGDDRACICLCLPFVCLGEDLLFGTSFDGARWTTTSFLLHRCCCLCWGLWVAIVAFIDLKFASRYSQLGLLERLALLWRGESNTSTTEIFWLLLHTNEFADCPLILASLRWLRSRWHCLLLSLFTSIWALAHLNLLVTLAYALGTSQFGQHLCFTGCWCALLLWSQVQLFVSTWFLRRFTGLFGHCRSQSAIGLSEPIKTHTSNMLSRRLLADFRLAPSRLLGWCLHSTAAFTRALS